jgi:hypothetical protein
MVIPNHSKGKKKFKGEPEQPEPGLGGRTGPTVKAPIDKALSLLVVYKKEPGFSRQDKEVSWRKRIYVSTSRFGYGRSGLSGMTESRE